PLCSVGPPPWPALTSASWRRSSPRLLAGKCTFSPSTTTRGSLIQILGVEMAFGSMPGDGLAQCRLLSNAQVDGVGAARREGTSPRRAERVGRQTGDGIEATAGPTRDRKAGQEPSGVRVAPVPEQLVDPRFLHDLARVEDHHPKIG